MGSNIASRIPFVSGDQHLQKIESSKFAPPELDSRKKPSPEKSGPQKSSLPKIESANTESPKNRVLTNRASKNRSPKNPEGYKIK